MNKTSFVGQISDVKIQIPVGNTRNPKIPSKSLSYVGFAPTVSIPLDEVIEYYGDPDYVWFTSDSTTEGTTTGLLLYWDSVKVFVELPQIRGKTYPVHRKTDIERIIFYDDQDVTVLAGQPISEEKTVWTGYGDYQP